MGRVFGPFWKCARIGERLSPYVSICCVLMAVSAGSDDHRSMLFSGLQLLIWFLAGFDHGEQMTISW